ncbi:MAG: hypothetical protein KME56_01645 [Candidatus Thiodiazotropha sp. (ex Ctena orbiculata)]|nr:hypothetical protein [Candidatus Thiodiazotropha taylori]MBV2109443.1 hypothetical protein [Candidatus Thiodiazotropha taylori]
MKKHAGEIALLHSSEEGTTFEIRLPVRPAINEAAERKLWRKSGHFQVGYPGPNVPSMKKVSD